ncbi:MAG: hypothetical protein PHP54_00765 [Clostridia bacterium]|nr:hypothetical protein [Clostridia bacterium]
METFIVIIITVIIVTLTLRSNFRMCKIDEFISNVYMVKQFYTLYCEKFDSSKYCQVQHHFHSFPSFVGSKEELGNKILRQLSEIKISDSLKEKAGREDFLEAIRNFEMMECNVKYDIWLYTGKK